MPFHTHSLTLPARSSVPYGPIPGTLPPATGPEPAKLLEAAIGRPTMKASSQPGWKKLSTPAALFHS